jgi:hypothetical protein
MDWVKIHALLEVVHKAAGVPEAVHIRNEALAALKVLNDAASPKTGPVELKAEDAAPELPLTARRV